MANPKDIPIIAIWWGGASTLRLLKGSDCKSEALKLGLDRHIPVGVIFKDNGTTKSLMDNSGTMLVIRMDLNSPQEIVYRCITFTCALRAAHWADFGSMCKFWKQIVSKEWEQTTIQTHIRIGLGVNIPRDHPINELDIKIADRGAQDNVVPLVHPAGLIDRENFLKLWNISIQANFMPSWAITPKVSLRTALRPSRAPRDFPPTDPWVEGTGQKARTMMATPSTYRIHRKIRLLDIDNPMFTQATQSEPEIKLTLYVKD